MIAKIYNDKGMLLCTFHAKNYSDAEHEAGRFLIDKWVSSVILRYGKRRVEVSTHPEKDYVVNRDPVEFRKQLVRNDW